MFAKLKQNYKLCNILACVAFVLTYAFSAWQRALGVTLIVLGNTNIWFALLSVLIVGVLFLFLVPFLVNTYLNVSRIFSVPRAEYVLLVRAFFALGFLLVGLLNLVNLFTPLFVTWGNIVFPPLVLTVCTVIFFRITSKKYFNDVTKTYYFKSMLIAWLILLVIVEVL